ncbi:type II toxin-antitoxin system RelE family toxin [Thalassovita litoralis]|uniref:type II toxin-antitoxin system RelE family toxin n=1 Tax=Thalassovita litoralis TaxID=1010611 RepID=UPI0038B57120
MKFEILFRSAAMKQFQALSKTDQRLVAAKIDKLGEDASPAGSKKLKGHDSLWRIRSGSLRVVYLQPDSEGRIFILKIGNRGRIYRNL